LPLLRFFYFCDIANSFRKLKSGDYQMKFIVNQ
jgi:hypothetical protein